MDIYNNLKSTSNITLENDNGLFELSSGGLSLKTKDGISLNSVSFLDLNTKASERSEKNANIFADGSAIKVQGWDSGPLTGLPEYNKPLNKVICVNGRYFAAHSSGGGLYASSNCLDWIKVLSGSFLNIIYHDGLFVVTGTSGKIYKSTDGNFWENVSIPQVGSVYGITIGEIDGSKVFVVTLDKTSIGGETVPFKIAYSQDIETWTIVDTIPEGATQSKCIEFFELPTEDGNSTEKLFFLCSNVGLFYSSDLATWTKVDIPTGVFGDLEVIRIKKLEDEYYYICATATEGLYRSLNPKEFLNPSLIANCDPAGGSYRDYNWDIAYSNGYYVSTQAASDGGYYWAEKSNVDENGVPVFTSSSTNDNGISHIKSYNGHVFAVNNFFILAHRGGDKNVDNGPSLTFMKMPLKTFVTSGSGTSSDLSDYATISYVDSTFATKTSLSSYATSSQLGNYIPKSEWSGGAGFGTENFFNLNLSDASSKVLSINNLKGNRIHGLKNVTLDNGIIIKHPETSSIISTLADISTSAPKKTRDNNANVYGWTGLVSDLGIEGTEIKITEVTPYRRSGNNPSSGASRLFLRILKKVDSSWTLAGQSINAVTFDSYTEADVPMGPFAIKPANGVVLEKTDTIAIVFVSDENADVSSSVRVGARTTSTLSGGLSAAISSDASSVTTVSSSPVFDVKYISTKSEDSSSNDGSGEGDVENFTTVEQVEQIVTNAVSSAFVKKEIIIDSEMSFENPWSVDLSEDLANFTGFPFIQVYDNTTGNVSVVDINYSKESKTVTISVTATVAANTMSVVVIAI